MSTSLFCCSWDWCKSSAQKTTCTREYYCFFVVRHVGTSTVQHTRHDTLVTTRTSVVTWRYEPNGIWAFSIVFSVVHTAVLVWGASGAGNMRCCRHAGGRSADELRRHQTIAGCVQRTLRIQVNAANAAAALFRHLIHSRSATNRWRSWTFDFASVACWTPVQCQLPLLTTFRPIVQSFFSHCCQSVSSSAVVDMTHVETLPRGGRPIRKESSDFFKDISKFIPRL